MNLTDRLRRIAFALPSEDSAIVLTKADLLALVRDTEEPTEAPDLTVPEVAVKTRRATSTVRGWLAAGQLRGYKLNGRDWRIPCSALRAFVYGQANPGTEKGNPEESEGSIRDWRDVR